MQKIPLLSLLLVLVLVPRVFLHFFSLHKNNIFKFQFDRELTAPRASSFKIVPCLSKGTLFVFIYSLSKNLHLYLWSLSGAEELAEEFRKKGIVFNRTLRDLEDRAKKCESVKILVSERSIRIIVRTHIT